MGNKTFIASVAAVFVAIIVLNPSENCHRSAFMDAAHNRFFELSGDYREIFQAMRSIGLASQKRVFRVRYNNFLIFSTLSFEENDSKMRRLLSIGALGFVFPIVN